MAKIIDDGFKINCAKTLTEVIKLKFTKKNISVDSFLTKDSPEEDFATFNGICNSLISEGAFDSIFKFITLFFVGETNYNLDAINAKFKNITVNKKYTLFDICNLFLEELDNSLGNNMFPKIRYENYFVATKMTVCKYVLAFSDKEITSGIPKDFSDKIFKTSAEIRKAELDAMSAELEYFEISESKREELSEKFAFGVLCSVLPAYRFNNDISQIDSLQCREHYLYAVENIVLPLFNKYYSRDKILDACCYGFTYIMSELWVVLTALSIVFYYKRFNSANLNSKEPAQVYPNSIIPERFVDAVKEKFDNEKFIDKLFDCALVRIISYGDSHLQEASEEYVEKYLAEHIVIDRGIAKNIAKYVAAYVVSNEVLTYDEYVEKHIKSNEKIANNKDIKKYIISGKHKTIIDRLKKNEHIEKIEKLSKNKAVQAKSAAKKMYEEKIKLVCAHIQIGEPLADFIINNEEMLNQLTVNRVGFLNQYEIDDLFVLALIFLFMCGNDKKCIKLLTENKHKIASRHIQTPYIKLFLSKLILSCDDKNTAEDLKVFTQFGISDAQLKSRKTEIVAVADKLADKLLKIEEHIKSSEYFTYYEATKQLYDNYKIKSFIADIKATIASGEVPSKSDFKRLCTTAEAFAWNGCIHFGMLHQEFPEIPAMVDNDDKLIGIPYELWHPITEILEESKNLISTHYPETEQCKLWLLMKVLLDKHLVGLAVDSALKDFEKVKGMKNNVSDEFFLQELDKNIQELADVLHTSNAQRGEIKNAKEKLNGDVLAFIKEYFPEQPDKNLYYAVSNAVKEDIEKYLVTSKLVYDYLNSLNNSENLDYAPALISLTKAIELILCENLYKPMKVNMYNKNYINNDVTKPKDKPFGINNEAMGTYVGLIWDRADKNKSKIEKVSGKLTVTNPNKHFDFYGGNNCLNIPVLKNYKKVDLRLLDYSLEHYEETETPVIKNFGNDNEENRLLLACSLDYIRAKYRNPVAHKDIIQKTVFEDARNSLLYDKEYKNAHGVFWMLLSILKKQD